MTMAMSDAIWSTACKKSYEYVYATIVNVLFALNGCVVYVHFHTWYMIYDTYTYIYNICTSINNVYNIYNLHNVIETYNIIINTTW